MKRGLGIIPKLTLVFVIFAALLLAGIGLPSYINARQALQAATTSELLSTAIEKQEALNTWVQERQDDIAALANTPYIIDDITSLTAAEPGSLSTLATYTHLLNNLAPRAGAGKEFLKLTIIEPESARVAVSTDPTEEGKYRENLAYFISGKLGPYIQNVYYSITLQAPAMTAAAPVYTADGRLVGVLAGELNLDEMNAIITRRTGLHQSDDAFLVNTAHLFVTQPRLVSDPAVLKMGVHTEAVNRCLERSSGSVLTPDYRGVPVIAVYRWLPERELCLVVKLNQAEAFAPVQALGLNILLTAILVFFMGSGAALWLAGSITRPVRQLVQGAEQIGQGNLTYHIDVHGQDELGQLGQAFNHMAGSLLEYDTKARAWATELEKRVEERTEELQKSEANYRILPKISPVGIFRTDAQGLATFWNDKLCSLTGMAVEEALGTGWTLGIHPDDRQLVFEKWTRCTQNRLPFKMQFRFIHKNGSVAWTIGEADAILDAEDHVIGSVGTVTDITEIKQAEETLRLKDYALESTLNAIAIADLAGNLFYINPSFLRNWGFDAKAQVLGRSAIEFWEWGEKFADIMQIIITQGAWSGELVARRKDGTLFDVQLSASIVSDQDGRATCMMASFIDITERKQMEEALKESEQRFRGIFDKARDGLLLSDTQTHQFIMVNDSMSEMIGYDQDEIRKMSVEELHPPEELPFVLEQFRRLAAREMAVAENVPVKRKNGSIFYADISNSFVTVKDRTYIVGFFRDITERKQIETALADKTADLARSNAELERLPISPPTTCRSRCAWSAATCSSWNAGIKINWMAMRWNSSTTPWMAPPA
jgi:PAS domain S-box-containing protein